MVMMSAMLAVFMTVFVVMTAMPAVFMIMFLIFMIMTAMFAIFVFMSVIMAAMLAMFMMMLFRRFTRKLFQLCFQGIFLFDRRKQLFPGQFLPIRRDNGGVRMLPQQRDCFRDFLRIARVREKIMQFAVSIWSLKNSPKFFIYILHFAASTIAV